MKMAPVHVIQATLERSVMSVVLIITTILLSAALVSFPCYHDFHLIYRTPARFLISGLPLVNVT